MSRLIIVEGLPCSGKSTTARYIAEKLGYTFVDEGSGDHPADYEFHAFLTVDDMTEFSRPEQKQILSAAENRCGGFVVRLAQFSGELFDKLLAEFKIPPEHREKMKEYAARIASLSDKEIIDEYLHNCRAAAMLSPSLRCLLCRAAENRS